MSTVPTLTVPTDALGGMLARMARDASGYAAQGKRPSGQVLKLLRAFLFTYASGACVVCGRETALDGTINRTMAVVGHIIPCGPNALGYAPGNVANMCGYCNAAASNTDLSGMVERFVYPERIPTMWPTFTRNRAENDPEKEIRRTIRKGNGLTF